MTKAGVPTVFHLGFVISSSLAFVICHLSFLEDEDNTEPLLANLGICLSLAVLTWLVFSQTLWHDFINYDDPRYVYENTRITGGLSISVLPGHSLIFIP